MLPRKRNGPAITPDRSPENSTTADEARESVTDAADDAAFLELSDALDVSLSLRLAAWREGYEAGRADGIELGRRQVLAEEAADRRAIARLVTGARPGRRYRDAAELDRRRYPPDGRLSWLLAGEGGA